MRDRPAEGHRIMRRRHEMDRMNNRLLMKVAIAAAAGAMLQACVATAPTIGDNSAKTVTTGAAGGGTAQNANSALERCSAPLGTIAIVEDTQAPWYQYLTQQYRLSSTIPLLKLMVQQSNCFIVLDRGKALNQAMGERALQQSGELRQGSNFGKGQMVSADYALNPEIVVSERGTQQVGAALGRINPWVGLIAGGFSTNEAATVLTLVDNRSSVQVAAAEGSSKNTDFALGGFLGGGSGAAGLGGYSSTPQGKVVAAAFMNAFNQMVIAARSYTPQSMGDRGLGTGGKLAVDGAAPAPAAAPAAKPVAANPSPAAVRTRATCTDGEEAFKALKLTKEKTGIVVNYQRLKTGERNWTRMTTDNVRDMKVRVGGTFCMGVD